MMVQREPIDVRVDLGPEQTRQALEACPIAKLGLLDKFETIVAINTTHFYPVLSTKWGVCYSFYEIGAKKSVTQQRISGLTG